jgi:hypothetical protein
MQAASDHRYVTLTGGITVPLTPLRLLLDLESRGFKVSRDGDDIFIAPFSKLSDDDRKQLKAWKPDVLTLPDYEAPRCA